MSRLVVVSNRLPTDWKAARPDDRGLPVGGLASALHAALRRSRGSLWFGWNGRIAPAGRAHRLARSEAGGVPLAGISLTEREHAGYYLGYCNETLWPLFHCFQGRMRADRDTEACYREVNARFAAALRPLLRSADLVWVHDYHLIDLGRELRKLGWAGRTGFFLHIPFPPHDLFELLPDPRDLLLAMLHYDLVGLQTRSSLQNYVACCRRETGASWDGARLAAGGRLQRAGVYPIGIDPDAFAPAPGSPAPGRMSGDLTRVVRGRRLILGVDRLDYTKGIPERILAFEELIRRYPRWRRRVSFVQIASPSRTRIPHYVEQRRHVESLVGRINGEHADHDWVPIRYLYRSYPPRQLARFYRETDVALVTPLRDGMNLVAKEFVAAQDPDAPGVLVLSRFAGAAEEMREAVLVNPYVPADVADGVARALAMPSEERRERHAGLLARVRKGTVEAWSRRFVEDLGKGPGSGALRRRTRAKRDGPSEAP